MVLGRVNIGSKLKTFPFPNNRTPLASPSFRPIYPPHFHPRNIILRMSSSDSYVSEAFPNPEPHPWPQPQDWPAAKVRQTFLDYFCKQNEGLNHTFWPSSSVVPFEDPTLLFANAVSSKA